MVAGLLPGLGLLPCGLPVFASVSAKEVGVSVIGISFDCSGVIGSGDGATRAVEVTWFF